VLGSGVAAALVPSARRGARARRARGRRGGAGLVSLALGAEVATPVRSAGLGDIRRPGSELGWPATQPQLPRSLRRS